MVPGCALALGIEMSLTHSAPVLKEILVLWGRRPYNKRIRRQEEPLYCAQCAVSTLTERSSSVAQDEFWRRMRFWKF